MKLLRIGNKGNEKPGVLDKDGKIRDISSHVKDLNPDHLNFETISKLQSADLSSLPELSASDRIGSCITKLSNTRSYSICLLYTSPSPRDATLSRMPSSA